MTRRLTETGHPEVGGMDDDGLLPSLMTRGMDEGLKLLWRLQEAEAKERRLRTELASAIEEGELARERYDHNRDFVRNMWETLKEEWTSFQREKRNEAGVQHPASHSASEVTEVV